MPAEPAPDGPDSAVPPVGARLLAFAGILVGGACGGLIGWAVVDIQSTDAGTTARALGALAGAVFAAVGVAVVAVLALRAMGEWRTIQHGHAAEREFEQRAEDPPRRVAPAPRAPQLPPGGDDG